MDKKKAGADGTDAGTRREGGMELHVAKGNKLYTNVVLLHPADAQALTPAGLDRPYLLVNLHLYFFKCATSLLSLSSSVPSSYLMTMMTMMTLTTIVRHSPGPVRACGGAPSR